jgi:alanine-glyoxylate transaminase / serine-glyoxylate transaminase / serine-pyruvate transaminase
MMPTSEQLSSSPDLISVQPPKRYLFGPGPTQVHPRVYEAMSRPIVSHVDPYFFEIAEGIEKKLRTVFGTTSEHVFVISGTGSGGMECAISNFVEPGTKVAQFVNGFFTERMCEMAKRQGAVVARLEKPWGETFTDDEAREFILREKPQVVQYVQAETSAGAFQQGRAICEAAHDIGAIVVADCVTSLGAMPVDFDKTGIDVAYSCTQKGLSCPPGLSPMALSPGAMERLKARKTTNRSWYFDLTLLNDYFHVSHKYHHTASATLFYALHEGLTLIQEEGFENRTARHHRMHLRFVNEVEALGLKMHVAEGHRIWNLNTPRIPDGVDDAKVRKYLLEKYGIEILGGFGQLAGKVFRIGVMGPLATDENVSMFFEKFKEALNAQ